jgi:hypothetical protein
MTTIAPIPRQISTFVTKCEICTYREPCTPNYPKDLRLQPSSKAVSVGPHPAFCDCSQSLNNERKITKGGPMATRLTLVLAAALALVPASVPAGLAQMRGAARPAPGYGSARHGASSFNHRRGGVPFGYFLGDNPYFYDDYPYEQPAPESAPQFVMMQQAIAADTPPQPKAAPLLIELEGDRYVRYGGSARRPDTGETPPAPVREPRASSDPTGSSARQTEAVSSAALAPTVLVYRDGHQEQIPDYAIVGRILYAHSVNNAQPGYGIRSIEVSALDIPATVAANRENGVNFVLPAGPNEVVTRP